MQKIFLGTCIFAIAALLMPMSVQSQEVVEVKGVTGIGVIVGRISFEDAKREALNQAKIEALRLAGVNEQLQSFEMLFRSEINNDFTEFFSSDIHAELRGAVKHYSLVSTETKTNPQSNLPYIEVTINATVILYSNGPDPAFNVKVEGIKAIYNENEYLTFSIISTKDCYLNIFGISDSYTSLLYPNKWEKFKLIEAGKKVSFPMGRVDYPLTKGGKSPEITRAVFVFTKEPIGYLNYVDEEEQNTTSEEIFSWIYSIMPDQRNAVYQVFTVR